MTFCVVTIITSRIRDPGSEKVKFWPRTNLAKPDKKDGLPAGVESATVFLIQVQLLPP